MKRLKKVILVFSFISFLLIPALMGKVSAQIITMSNTEQTKSKSETISAVDVLKGCINALSNLTSVEYEVKVDDERPLPMYEGRIRVKANTKISAVSSPLRATGKLQGYDGTVYETFVLNNDVMRTSVAGKTDEFNITKGIKPLMSYGDLNNTWRMLLDREFFSKIIEDGRILYAGQDYIEDDLCNIVLKVGSNSTSSSTSYYWISTKTNLPRALQVFVIDKYGRRLLSQRIITISKINPQLSPDVFDYKPTEKDSATKPPSSSQTSRQPTIDNKIGTETRHELKSIQSTTGSDAEAKLTSNVNSIAPTIGVSGGKGEGLILSLMDKKLHDLFVDNLIFQKVRISDLVKKPTLITFWATWCGPCVKEMPAFQRLADKYQDKLQILAIASGDSRPDSISFINNHPEFKFTFLIDPDWQKTESSLANSLGLTTLPTNLLIDPNGKVVSAWLGNRSEAEWSVLIDNFLAK